MYFLYRVCNVISTNGKKSNFLSSLQTAIYLKTTELVECKWGSTFVIARDALLQSS